MVTTFSYKPSLVRIDARNFELSWATDSDTQTHAARPLQTRPQTGPITIHCAAKLSAQCNKRDYRTIIRTQFINETTLDKRIGLRHSHDKEMHHFV